MDCPPERRRVASAVTGAIAPWEGAYGMKRLLVALGATVFVGGCGNAQEQAVKDAGYLLRMNQVACHFAAAELAKVNDWLNGVLKEHPALEQYANRGAAEAEDVYAKHHKAPDGEQRDQTECEKVRALAQSWPTSSH